jgi:hypothetical protein
MLFIKESYVHEFQWVGCHAGNCGYERDKTDSNWMEGGKTVLLRMFKVNGQQTCEACMREAAGNIQDWLEDGEEE